MQPVNEALLTDEEFLSLIEKQLTEPLRNQTLVSLRAETVQRLLTIIQKQNSSIALLLASGPVGEMVEEPGEIPISHQDTIPVIKHPALKTLYSQEKVNEVTGTLHEGLKKAAIGDTYLKLRTDHKKIGDLKYEVILGVVNRPVSDGFLMEISREDLTNMVSKFVGRPIGELDHCAVTNDLNGLKAVGDAVDRISTIKGPEYSGVLDEFEISGIRDGSGALLVVGKVSVSQKVADMLDSKEYVYAVRSLINPQSAGCTKSKISQITAFDLLAKCNLNIPI